MGISPDRYTPRWDGSPQDLKDYGTAGANLGSGLTAGFNNVIGGIGDAIRGIFTPGGIFSPVGEAIKPIRDVQLDLLQRTELLEGIQGYCAAYQSQNINAQWSQAGWRDLPYTAQLGPSKAISVDAVRGQMILQGPGMYVAYARAFARGTGFTGSDNTSMVIEVVDQAGTVQIQSFTEKFVPRGNDQTILSIFPFVVPAAGWRVRVRVYSGNWRWWDGGTSKSTLHIIKHSSSSENTGRATVPDESDPTPPA